jgi:hypothetical protein
MQTSSYFSHSESRRRIARTVEVTKGRDDASVEENKYRSLGCGFYIKDTNRKYEGANGGYSNVSVKTASMGPGGELFFESKETARSMYGRATTEIRTAWAQMTTLEVFGSEKPVAVGNRYGRRAVTTTKERVSSSSNECHVTGQRPASEFHPRLTGNAFITKCKSEYSDEKDHTRTASSSLSVSFPDSPAVPGFNPSTCRLQWRAASEFHPRAAGDAFVVRCKSGETPWVYLLDQKVVFNPDECRLEVRAATEFHPSLQGAAYAVRCRESSLNSVYFPHLEESFFVDSIDGTFKSDPQERKLLTEIELMRQ